jgi:aryl carrier-like protein
MAATGEMLDLERMRADVARVLECTPAEIGDDDNLIDLDLDSMRMLGLVLAWGNTGLPLVLAAGRAHHAAPVVERGADAAGRAERMNAAALATPVALTEAQAGLWFAQRLAPDNPSFNTAHAVWIDGPLDVAAFVAAADQAAGEARPSRCALPKGPMASRCSGATRHTCRCFRCVMFPPRRIPPLRHAA